MKISVLVTLLFVTVLAGGCGLFHQQAQPAIASPAAAETTPAIVTPDNSLIARVVLCNSDLRYVILRFPVSQMPKLEQSLFLYRNGMKVGEVKITGPQDNNNNIVADLVTGEAQVGDEVRDK